MHGGKSDEKRHISVLVMVAMLLSLMPVIASAATSDSCGYDLTWTFDGNGTLTISGTGDMDDYQYQVYGPWGDYQSEIQTVVIKTALKALVTMLFMSVQASQA